MFSKFVNSLTLFTGNRLDFSRGFDFSRSINSAKTGALRYTIEEALIRSTIIITTAVGGYLGYYLNTQGDEDPVISNTAAIAFGLTAGLALGHIPVVYNILIKRARMIEESDTLIKDIKEQAENLDISQDLINSVTDTILKSSLANGKNSNASQTLGRINSLLKELKVVLTNQTDHESAEALLNRLMTDNNIELVFKREISLESIVDASAINFKK